MVGIVSVLHDEEFWRWMVITVAHNVQNLPRKRPSEPNLLLPAGASPQQLSPGGKRKGQSVHFQPDRKTSVLSLENMGDQLLCKDEM